MDTPCTDSPDLWFTDTPAGERAAVSGCLSCPLKARTACLRAGIADDRRARAAGGKPSGVWGGFTPRERARLAPAPKRARVTWTADMVAYVRNGRDESVSYGDMATVLGVSEMAVRKCVARMKAANRI